MFVRTLLDQERFFLNLLLLNLKSLMNLLKMAKNHLPTEFNNNQFIYDYVTINREN